MRERVSSPLGWLAGLLVLYLLAPIAAFLARLGGGVSSSPGLGAALLTSLLTATVSAALVTTLGVPLAYLLARGSGIGVRVLSALVALPLALPPLMSGLLLLYVLGPYTVAGKLFGGNLTDTTLAIVLAQSFVAAPFLVIAARAAFAGVDPALEDVAASLGHGRLARFSRVALSAALPGVAAGALLAWLRAFGEFGATVILAYHPYSLPVFTFVQFDATGLPATDLPIAASLAAALAVLLLVQLPPPRRRRSRRAPVAPRPALSTAPATLDFALAKRLGSFELALAYAAATPRLAVLGPSGAGKTLTLRLLAGLSANERGHVRSGELELDRVAVERRRIGYVPQQPALLPRRTVWRQVTFAARAEQGAAAWWIERLGLGGLEDRYPEELSGGQQRRVEIARALASEPRLLLLDEPFTGLDSSLRARLARELRRLQVETGLSTVIVTHDPQEAALLADEILVIDEGSLVQAGTRRELFTMPCSPRVATWLGIANTHHGTVLGSGRIRCGALELQASTGGLRAGTQITWSVPPERIAPNAAGGYEARVLDILDLGACEELLLELAGGVELSARPAPGRGGSVAVGDTLRVGIAPADIGVWRAGPALAPVARGGW